MMANGERGALAPRAGRRRGEARPATQAVKSPPPVRPQPFRVIDAPEADPRTDSKPGVAAVRTVNRQRRTLAGPAVRPALADDVKNAFRQLIEQCEAGEQAARHEQHRAARARADFENEFRSVMEHTIVPTLDEVGNLLGRACWICRTVPSAADADVGVSFEASRPTMETAADGGLPRITFSSVPEHLTVGVSCFTRLGGNGRPEYRLDEISSDFVARQTLLFVRQLVSDWAAGGF